MIVAPFLKPLRQPGEGEPVTEPVPSDFFYWTQDEENAAQAEADDADCTDLIPRSFPYFAF